MNLPTMATIKASHRAFYFRMTCMADQYRIHAILGKFSDFDMYFGNERASGIKDGQVTTRRLIFDRFWDPMRRENDNGSIRHFM